MVDQVIGVTVVIALGLITGLSRCRWRRATKFVADSLTRFAAVLQTHAGKSSAPALSDRESEHESGAQTHETFKAVKTWDDFPEVACSFIDEWIGIKDLNGAYVWVNLAFANGVGRAQRDLVGLSDRDVFGYVSARKLAVSDQQAFDGGLPTVTTEEIQLESGSRHFQISKVLLENVEGEIWGLISVWRDLTEEVKSRNRREKAMHQTVKAFAKSIQFSDPYLADHSYRLARVATAVVRAMGLDESAVTTIELAAMLSQVGKLGVDANILRKPGRLSDEERKQVEQHVSYASRLLRDFDFGLPIVETIWQMHERLDGQGYPLALKGPEISVLALILGACDVFCARIEPRAFRSKIPPERALQLLEQNLHRYDASVVRALKEVILSPEGKELMTGEQAN